MAMANSFATGLINSLTKSLDERLQIKRQREEQERQMQLSLAQQQAMFEQQQQQQAAAFPAALERRGAEMRQDWDIKTELMKKAQDIKIETTPGLREALINGQLDKIPSLVITQSDVDFVNMFKKLAKETVDPSDETYKKEAARQRAITEAKSERIKQGIEKAPGQKYSGGSSGRGSTKPASKIKEIDRAIERKKAEIAKEASYSDADPAIIRAKTSELKELESRRDAVTGNVGTFEMTEEERAAALKASGRTAAAPTPTTQTPAATTSAPAKRKTTAHGQSLLASLKKFRDDVLSAKPPVRKARQ